MLPKGSPLRSKMPDLQEQGIIVGNGCLFVGGRCAWRLLANGRSNCFDVGSVHFFEFPGVGGEDVGEIERGEVGRRFPQLGPIGCVGLELAAPCLDGHIRLDQAGIEADISRLGRIGKWPGEPAVA